MGLHDRNLRCAWLYISNFCNQKPCVVTIVVGSAARIRVGWATGQLYSVQRASCKCECVMANRWSVVPSDRTRVRDPTAKM